MKQIKRFLTYLAEILLSWAGRYGKIEVDISPEARKFLKKQAREQGKTISELVTEALRSYINNDTPLIEEQEKK